MIYKVEELLTKEYACTPEELHGTGTIFSIRADAKEPYIKILAYRNCVVVCTSKDLHEKIRGLLAGKSRDEIFELPYVYGQTVHYITSQIRVLRRTPLHRRIIRADFFGNRKFYHFGG